MAQVQTRKEQSIKIYNRIVAKFPDPKVARPKVIAELEAKIGMTHGGASTYYANVKNGTWSMEAATVKAAPKPEVKVTAKPPVKMKDKAKDKVKSARKAKPANPEAEPATV